MSIQSNINNTIGQASILATLNPAIQELGETAKDKSKIKSVEKQLDTLKEQANKAPDDSNYDLSFSDERDLARYNQLSAVHNELAGKLSGRGESIDYWYPDATTDKAIRLERVAKIKANIQRAREQRQKVEAIQQQKEAEEKAQKEFRSKQIRDLIMNPNLEVNNGTGNDTRR